MVGDYCRMYTQMRHLCEPLRYGEEDEGKGLGYGPQVS